MGTIAAAGIVAYLGSKAMDNGYSFKVERVELKPAEPPKPEKPNSCNIS